MFAVSEKKHWHYTSCCSVDPVDISFESGVSTGLFTAEFPSSEGLTVGS